MSKGKKGNKATPEAVSWDEGLLNALVEEDDWKPCLVFTCPNALNDEPHLEVLANAISAGTRRRFSLIDKTTMLQSAAEDVKVAQAATSGGGAGKKSKAGATPPVQKPMFVEVCEQVVDQMKSGNPLPASLLAKMIKYKVLRHRTAYQATVAQKEAEEAAKKQAAEKGGEGKGGKGGGRASKAGKKGKETPAADSGPAIPLPEIPPTSMRKRGEEDLDSKYIDDEPIDGPTCYFIMTGFTSLDILEQLAPVGLTAHILINIEGGSEIPETLSNDGEIDDEQRKVMEQHNHELNQFWQCLDQCVQATKDGHMLRDMAQVKLTVPQPLVPETSDAKELYGQSIFDAVSQSVYRVLEQRTQYSHYLNYLKLRQLSLPYLAASSTSPIADTTSQSSLPTQSVAVETPAIGEPVKADMRLYTNLLSVVPQTAITIPLMLHCMKEQVCAALTPTDSVDASLPTSQPALHSDVLAELTNPITGLCIPTSTKRSILPDTDEGAPDSNTVRVTTSIEYWDRMKLLSYHLSDSKCLNITSSQSKTNSRSSLCKILSVPLISVDKRNDHLAMLHSLQHYCTSADISTELLNHVLLVLSLENVQLPNATSFPGINVNSTPLQFDFPLDITVKEKHTQQSTSLVPYSNAENGRSSAGRSRGDSLQHKYDLDLPTPYTSLSEYTVCEPMSKSSLLQLLQSLQHTHRYLSVHYHKLSQSTLIVAHSGFNGQPLHSYSWQSLAHSRVGFNNYLQYIAQQFGKEIDRAVEEDELRREAFEEQRCSLMEDRRRELEQQQQRAEALKEEQDEPKMSAKGGKKSATSSAKKTPPDKKSKGADKASTTPEPAEDTAADIEAGLPEFPERTLYEAYDVEDTILLNKGQFSVQFLSDGSQIHTERRESLKSDTMIAVSALSNGHVVSCSMLRRETEAKSHSADKESENEEKDKESSHKKDKSPAACIPQPPPGVEFASLTAQFRESLYVSLSHFGPNGNGTLPYEPPKPAVLLEPHCPDTTLSESRPQSRQTPQKMNKKQMEQQQQLLEQQQQLEEQKKKERAEAQELYDRRYSALLRQNKYQQLFVSTPYGLHLHSQVNVGLSADPALTDGSDGSIIVRQSYPVQSQNTSQGEAGLAFTTYSEMERYYLPDGSVLRFMKDGSIAVLCSDGHVYQTATKSLCDCYHQGIGQVANEEVGEGEINTPLVQPTFSDTKVTFVDQLNKIPTVQERNISDIVWVTTSPTGQRYMWKCPVVNKSTGENENEENEGVLPNGDKEAGPDNCDVPDPDSLPQASVVPLPSAQVFAATDPVTKQVMINREDNVTMLKCPDGSFVAEHADGTRITTTVRPNDPSTPLEIMAECPGFARVTHTASKECYIHFPDGSEIVASTTGHYSIEKKEEYQLEIKPCGEGRCVLQPAQSTAHTFTLNHTGVSNILMAKSKESKVEFSVSQDGSPAVSRNVTIPPHHAFLPRYFMVPSKGDPYQILSQTELNSFLTSAESQSDTTTVKGVPVPGFEGTTVTVMKALRSETPGILPYKNGSIIPKNLSLNPAKKSNANTANGKRRFGVGVGKSLSIPTDTNEKAVLQEEVPNAVRRRQFVSFEQFNDSSCQRIREGLASYIASRRRQQSAENDLLPVDLRDPSERKAAQDLKSEWLTKVSGDILSLALQDVHQQNTQIVASDLDDREPSTSKPTSVLKQKAELDRQALRNHTVPLYFDSDKGKQFLRSQSPDMNELALQLARPKPLPRARHNNTLSEVSHSSTPSTLQSASIILQPVDGDSPDVGEVDAVSVSSVSKIRPAHPTPDHARGLHTPTDIRPTNPTPSHATRLHSPAASIVSQPDTIKFPTQRVGGTDMDMSVLESDTTAERSVSFMLPPRPHSLGVGESSPDVQKGKTRPSKLGQSKGGTTKNKPNTKVREVEDTVCRKIRTSSTMTGGLVRGFEVQPQTLDFGVIQEGCTYARSLTLKNVGIDSCRFKIKQPPPSTGIKVIYTPGPVAAGMSRQCEVEMFAIAVGAVGNSGTGFVSHDLEVISEANILQIPAQATVLTRSEYAAQQAAPCPLHPAAGVREIQRPSSREDFKRPQKPAGKTNT